MRYKRFCLIISLLTIVLIAGHLQALSDSDLRESASYDALIMQGNQSLKAGKLSDAYEDALAAEKMDGKRFDAYALAALALHRQGSYAKAKENLDEALSRVPAEKRDALAQFQKILLANIETAGRVAAVPENLTPEARRKFAALRLILDEANSAKVPQERLRLINEFLGKSAELLQTYPLQTNLWLLRAATALEANKEIEAREAGNKLIALGLDDSQDPKLVALMAKLERKGWLGTNSAAEQSITSINSIVLTKAVSLPKPGASWENSLGMKFVPVPGAEVLFCIWDVRVQDFEAFVNATSYDATGRMYSLRSGNYGQHGDTWRSPGFSQGPTHPVVGVSWQDAMAFCDWLTKKEQTQGKISESQSYRLPRETEWNQAVGNTKFPWGDDWPPPVGAGNYAGSEAKDANWPRMWQTINGYWDGYARTSPVGSFNANRYGLYDMGGNVWQWCEDKFDNQHDWRVLRGGSWGVVDPVILLSSCRRSLTPGIRIILNGFRVVLVVGGSAAR